MPTDTDDPLGRLDPDDFTAHVVEWLRNEGNGAAADWTDANHRDGRALGPVEVAREEGIRPTAANVEDVARACLGGFHDWRSGQPEAVEAAEAYRQQLDALGVVRSTWREGDVVRATTGGPGVHLLNQAEAFRADVHLICATDGVREAGNLPDDDGCPECGTTLLVSDGDRHLCRGCGEPRDDHDHGPIFFNVKVHGYAED